MKEEKQKAIEWVKAGKPCAFRYGWGYRGAPASRITTDEAMKLLPKYDFGMGFYVLSFCKNSKGENILLFNELSENDLY